MSFLMKENFRGLFNISWDIFLYFLILIFGISYSNDTASALKVIETNFSFIAMSFIFLKRDDFNTTRLNRIFYFFSFGLFVACLICITNAFFEYLKSEDVNAFLFYNLTNIINSHPTYLAYYLVFSITFFLYLLHYQKSTINPSLIAAITLFFFFMLLLTGGETSFISLLFVFSFYILKFFLTKNSRLQKLTFVLVSVMLISLFVINSLNQDNRQEVLNDSWDRFALWESVIAANPNFIFGVGTGDYKEVLNAYYDSHQMKEFSDTSFNSHNQFLQILFSNGSFGLLSVILLIARPLYIAFNNDDSLGLLAFFPFLIYGMTEVFLGRYQGVVFFALLHQTFISYYNSLARASSLKIN